jgi:NADH:ubiquinone oxidoreductase subunit 3 (subunit A)
MIKNDPQRLALRKSARAIIIVSILFIILAVIFYFLPSSSGQRSFNLPFLYLIAMFFFLAALALVFYTVKRLDKRRSLAVLGDQSMLATEQPVPNVNALPLPISIELRPPNRFYYIWLGAIIVGGLTGGIIVPFLFHTGNHTGNHSSLIVLIIVLAILVAVLILMLAILFFILRKQMRYQVHVDEQGISVSYSKITTRVDWNTARLFTVNAVKKPRRPRVYELANEDTLVRWMWVQRDSTPLFIFRPTIPQEEFDRQMQGLLEVVAGKTHLPLYDISEPRAKWWM